MPTHPLELSLLLTYLLLGPVAWGFYLFMIHLGRKRMKLMRRPAPDVPGDKPLVTILIPAKDEGERIRGCLLSAIGQDYPRLEVIAIDDRSTDETGRVMDELAAAHPGRLRVLHVVEPPPVGWTGKNNALHQGVKLATGEWLLFVDSDVVLDRDALDVAMAVSRRKNFDMVSLLPRLECATFGERLAVPLCAATAGSICMMALNNVGEVKTSAFANGQFMLMKRSAYDTIGGHAAVRDRFCEDVSIARLFKEHGLRPRIAWGTDYASVRMYDSLAAAIRGWSRIYYAARFGKPGRLLAAMAFILLCVMTVVPALAWGLYRLSHPAPAYFGSVAASWLVGPAVHLLFITLGMGMTYVWSRNPFRYALLFVPLGAPLVFYILCKSVKMCVTRKVEWRGTSYSAASDGLAGAATVVSDARLAADQAAT
ncbi:MAG TPA: glycosyltransferase family 2 protein [Humisphaera sp.]